MKVSIVINCKTVGYITTSLHYTENKALAYLLITDLYIDEKFQRQGLGTFLIEVVKRNNTHNCMEAITDIDTAEFYKKVGFSQCDNPRMLLINKDNQKKIKIVDFKAQLISYINDFV